MENRESELVDELRKKVVILQCESEKGSCNVYLVGTNHVSKQSCEDVEAVISFLKPDVVFLELCKNRFKKKSGFLNSAKCGLTKVPKSINARAHSNIPNAFEFLVSLIMEKDAKERGVSSGSEFQIAYREAKKYGSKIVLGDRPINITCQRAWSGMSFSCKLYFVLACLSTLTPTSLTSLLAKLGVGNHEQFEKTVVPIMMETLVYERDLFMASTVFEAARECKSVVAVVGRGHLVGIQKNWKKAVDIESLMEVKSSSSVHLWISVALGALGISLFFLKWFQHSYVLDLFCANI